MRALLPLLVALLSACPSAEPPPPVDEGPDTWSLSRDLGAQPSAWDGGDVYASGGLHAIDGEDPPPLPVEGDVTFLGRAGDALLAFVPGAGLWRLEWADWSESTLPGLPLAGLLNPRGTPVPFGVDGDGPTVWLATIGGLLRSEDRGRTFASVPVGASGSLNVLFTDVVAFDQEVWAVAQLADSMLPGQFAGLLAGTVFHSADGGSTWEDASVGLGATAPTAVIRRASGEVCVASLDGGVACREGGGWSAKSEPIDAVALGEVEGRLVVGLAGGGLMIETDEGWHTTDSAPVLGLRDGRAITAAGELYSVDADFRPSAPPGQATVHLALSFHVNLYHSYRGDTNDEDGYGKDLRVMRTTLDWLDAHPGVHADWDIENHFSLDGWMQTDGADVLLRLQERVADGLDDVRLMSWNNGAMASSSREEFDASVLWGVESLEAAFGRVVPGVQPQENMITPDHLGWYRAAGIEWVTLFYAANGFTGPRVDIELTGRALHNPVTLTDPLGDSLTWLPVYHHADVLDHGGLAAWARQLRRSQDGDVLLAVHFDADGESWENFGAELDALQAQVDAGEVVYSTLQAYLDEHEPVASVALVGDQADGTGDGFQSWAEKDFNHRLATRIFEARTLADQARALAGDQADVQEALDVALVPRLLALSTTHFGLAAPFLADQRVVRAWEYADTAVVAAQDALDAAVAHLPPLEPGQVAVTSWRDAAGPTLVEIPATVPVVDWSGVDAVGLFDGGEELAIGVRIDDDGANDGLVDVLLSVVLDLWAGETRRLDLSFDDAPGRPTGALVEADAPDLSALSAPFTECGGARAMGSEASVTTSTSAGFVATTARSWDLGLCGAAGTVDVQQRRFDGLPGVIVEVEATLGAAADPDDAESIALSPLSCPGLASTMSWRPFGGGWRQRGVRAGADSWNGFSADGAVALGCADGSEIGVAHRVPERSSLAFAPFRERGGVAMLAPLGTLWGSGPFHAPRATGGSGVGEVVTSLVGSQYRPAAPDWAGQTVRYRLLVGSDLSPEALDLFAHPPLVRVGE